MTRFKNKLGKLRVAANHHRYLEYDDGARQTAYWALLAGACGHTYGHNCVWQMWTPDHKPALWANIP